MSKSHNTFKGIALMLLVIIGSSAYFYLSRKLPAGKPRRNLAIETKGLSEFNPDNDKTYSISKLDKTIMEEMNPIIQSMGDGKDIEKIIEHQLHLAA